MAKRRRKYKSNCERYMDYAHQLVEAGRNKSAKRAIRLYVRCIKKEMRTEPEWRREMVKKWEPEYLLSPESERQRAIADERRAARRKR